MNTMIFCLALLSVGQSNPTWPQPMGLTGENLLLIANRRVPKSAQFAHYYAGVRSVPTRQIILINMPDIEETSRSMYEKRIADPVRQFLKMQKLEDKIHCLVLFYGLPLRISAPKPTPQQRQLLDKLQAEYNKQVTGLEKLLQSMSQIVPNAGTKPATKPTTTLPKGIHQRGEILRRVNKVYRNVGTKVDAMKDPLEKRIVLERLLTMKLRIGGPHGIIAAIDRPTDSDGAQAYQQELKKIANLAEEIRRLRKGPIGSEQYNSAYLLIAQRNGIIGVLQTLGNDMDTLKQKDSMSALDSELSLLLAGEYSLAGRLPNRLNPLFAGQGPDGKVLMVSRLDGPGDAVTRIIDQSSKVQRKALTGKVYLDMVGALKDKDGIAKVFKQAAGSPKGQKYLRGNRNIYTLAELLRTHQQTLPVILDDRPEVFEVNSCPNTALYCGWYSLSKFVDAFEFEPGAVGYHIASFEAKTLRRPESQVWCKMLLERGITATLGPVAEPYLDAFPPPATFFGLLLTGKYTLVECYYLSKQYNSWRMILIGDPLYTPFQTRQLLETDQVPMGWEIPQSAF